MKFAILGPEGTYSETAAKLYKPDLDAIYCSSIPKIFDKVSNENVKGIVPVENSIEGIITRTLDLLMETGLNIIEEIVIEVDHYLIGAKRPEKIFSHPQALSQCRNFIETNFPETKIKKMNSTASAVEHVKKDPERFAAIGSRKAAEKNDLPVVVEKIQDFKENKTRFLVISKEPSPSPTGRDKTTIVFFVKDKPGALFQALKIFNENNINLSMLQSRPSRMSLGDYYFFVDLEGHIEEEKIKKGIERLKKEAKYVKNLGSYSRSPEY